MCSEPGELDMLRTPLLISQKAKQARAPQIGVRQLPAKAAPAPGWCHKLHPQTKRPDLAIGYMAFLSFQIIS